MCICGVLRVECIDRRHIKTQMMLMSTTGRVAIDCVANRLTLPDLEGGYTARFRRQVCMAILNAD